MTVPTLRASTTVALALTAAGYSATANASVNWEFVYTDDAPSTADLFLTTDDLSGSTYLITGISGTVDGYTITGLEPVNGYDGNDNLLNEGAPWLDGSGVSFDVDTLGQVNIWYDGPDYVATFGDEGGSFDLVTTPEPASVGLFGTALACLGWLRRRRLPTDPYVSVSS